MHQSEHTQDWIRTFTGKRFQLFDPTPDMVCIEDIAHALSMICRYTGHVQRFYSVAEHSCLLTGVVATRLRTEGMAPGEITPYLRWALLHDAAEAYVGDVTRPLKHQPEMELYRAVEANVMRVIAAKFGLVGAEPALIKRLDKEIIGTEARVLKWGEGLATVDPVPPMMPELRTGKMGVSPERAEEAFLTMWDALEASNVVFPISRLGAN